MRWQRCHDKAGFPSISNIILNKKVFTFLSYFHILKRVPILIFILFKCFLVVIWIKFLVSMYSFNSGIPSNHRCFPNWDPSGEWDGFEELLCRVDVFLPNEYSTRSLPRFSSARPCLAPFPEFYIILAEKVHLSFYPLFVSQALTRNNALLLLLIYRKIYSKIHLIIILKRMLC